jgi:hypothetical protein
VLDQYERLLNMCPDGLWEEPVWEVKKEHPWVWPVKRAGSKEQLGEEMLRVYSAFWNVAYHALFHVDYYLAKGVTKGFKPPPPFKEADHHGNTIPTRTYTRDELQRYVAYDRERVRTVIPALSDDEANAIVPRAGVPFGEFLVGTLTHTQEHAAQLQLFLGRHGIDTNTGAGDAARNFLRRGVRGRSDSEIDAFAATLGGHDRLLPLVYAGFCANLGPTDDCTVEFVTGKSYFIRAKAGKATVAKAAPKSVDATVRASPQDYLRWMTEDLELDRALAEGRITFEGDVDRLQRALTPAREC